MLPLTATRSPMRVAWTVKVTDRVVPWMVKSPVTGMLMTTPGAGIDGNAMGCVSTNVDVGYLSVSISWRYLASCTQWQVTVCMLTTIFTAVTVTCHCMHDAKYRQLMETDKYPTSTFVLTQ